MSDFKVEGKVADFCPKCKNCKSTTRECDGENDWLTEVECEDPYDGMIRTLAADSDICCSMFTPKPEDSRIEDLIKASKRKDDLIQNYHEKLKGLEEANENLLEKCKVYIDEKAELRLKIANLQSNIDFQKYLKDEAYKREDELKKELKKVKAHDEALTKHFQNDEKLIDNIQKVIFPQEEGSDYTYSYDEILNKVKELTKMIERRDMWVNDLQIDVNTLQNEILEIRNIAQKAYDDTNRD